MNELAIPKEVLAMANRVGDFIEYWGFKHVEGKIWTVLFLSSQPRDMAYLGIQLGLSKALVSTAVARLLEYRVIHAVHPERQRYQAYAANPNVLEVIFHVLRTRERLMLMQVQATAQALKLLGDRKTEALGFSPTRVRFLSRLVKLTLGALDSTLSLRPWDMVRLKTVAIAPEAFRDEQ